MAGTAPTLRQMAYRLYSDEPLVQKRGAGSSVCRLAGGRDPAGPIGGSGPGQHQREGAPRRDWGAPKKGLPAIGKSRGGWNTKLHLVAATERRAVTFAWSPGAAHDAPEGRALLCSLGPQASGPALLMDRAADGSRLRGQPHQATGLGLGVSAGGAAIAQSGPCAVGRNLRSTTGSCTKGAMKSSGCFGV